MNEAAQQVTSKPKSTKFGDEQLLPGAYTVDFSAVQNIQIKDNDQLSTFGELYVKLKDSKIEKMPDWFSRKDKYITDKEEIELDGDWPVISTMRKLIDLTRQGISPYEVTWFYFDHDWSRDADESYSFFIVHNGKILDESTHFSSEGPRILIKKQDNDPIWHTHPYLDAAWECYWYRKFYTETVAGQLMVLRPDEPILYHYERPRRDTLRDLEFVTLVKMYRLLWVVIPLLAAIAFPFLRLYMGIIAILLTIDVLWRAWATRKME
jgi:hypothetical protein